MLNARLGETLEALPDAILLVNQDGAIVFVNAQAERLFGHSREELLGAPVEMLVPEGLRSRHREHRADFFASPRVRPMRTCRDLYAVRKDGGELPVDINLSYQQTGEGVIAVVAARDITERKRIEEEIRELNLHLEQRIEERTRQLQEATRQAEEASRHKSQFLANMSHELRTPLNSILGFAELLQDQTFGTLTPKQARYLSHIHQSGKHLLALISDLLDLSKVEAGRLDLWPEAFTLSDALAAALEQFRAQADAKGLVLLLHLEQAPGTLVADPLRFKQILYNLLSNAVKFTPDGGRIGVTAKPKSPDFVEISVTDTGIGVKAEDLGRLFQTFTQLDNPLAKRQQGTGLGLALTKRLVELHGGSVTATSPGEGQGSAFTVTLPLRPPRTRGRILLVEEDERLRARIAEALQNAAFRVDPVREGEAALAQAARVPPDLVILDLVLSGLDGVEVLRRLRAEGPRQLPIIVLAESEGHRVEEALGLGAGEFLVKPVSLSVLTDAVERLLRKRGGEGVSALVRAGAEDQDGRT